MDKERLVLALGKVPKDILIHCAEQLIFGKKSTSLEEQIQELKKKLLNADGEEEEQKIMEQIRNLREKATGKQPGILIIPGAEYYAGNKYFSIILPDDMKTVIRDLRAVLKDNSLSELDLILIYLGDLPGEENDLYHEDQFKENDPNYQFSQEYKNFKNTKLLRIRDLVKARKSGGSGEPSCISRSKIPLRDYQVKVSKFINSPTQNSLLVVHGTGTGKTLSALVASQCYLDQFPNDKILVISPASLTGNFEKEMQKYGGKISKNYSFFSFTTFTGLNKGAYYTPFDMFYEDELDRYREKHPDDTEDELRYMMSKYFNEEVKVRGGGFEEYKRRASELNIQQMYDCKNTMVIIDEAHNMRNMGDRYDAVFRCVIQSKKLLLLTATPFVNNLRDFVPIINMLYRDENILKKKSRSMIPLKITSEDKFVKTLEVIYDFLKGKVTYLADKTSEFFPKVKMIKDEIDMSPSFFKKYEKALVADRKFGDAPEVFYNGFRRAVNAVGAEEYLNQKLDILLELIKAGRQTLVFTNWIEAGVSVLEQAFKDNDVSYFVISGNVPSSTRLDIVEKFNNKRVQVLIITLAGSEGLDLKEVRDVIILDPVWNPAMLEQIVGRAVRYKSHMNLPPDERKVDVHTLILKTPENANVPSGDEILYSFIYEKQKTLNEVSKVLKNASI